METIDVTPTAVESFRMLLMIIKNGTPANAKWAEGELLRYAVAIDKLRESQEAA